MIKNKNNNNLYGGILYMPNDYDFYNYSLGGWLKENKEGILGGLKAIGGGLLMGVPGMQGVGGSLLASGISGVVGEITDGNQSEMLAQQKSQMEQQRLNQIKMNQRSANANVNSSMLPTFPMGGMLPYSNAELEKEEVIQTPTGQVETVDGPSHKQGGVNISAPVGSRVFSDRLKPKGSKETYAELADKLKKQIDKYKKIINS